MYACGRLWEFLLQGVYNTSKRLLLFDKIYDFTISCTMSAITVSYSHSPLAPSPGGATFPTTHTVGPSLALWNNSYYRWLTIPALVHSVRVCLVFHCLSPLCSWAIKITIPRPNRCTIVTNYCHRTKHKTIISEWETKMGKICLCWGGVLNKLRADTAAIGERKNGQWICFFRDILTLSRLYVAVSRNNELFS